MNYKDKFLMYKAEHWKFTSNGIVELPPITPEVKPGVEVELPFLLLSILVIVVVVTAVFLTI